MNETLNILQICPRIPFPPNDGGKIGIYNITKQLALRGHRITMLTFADNDFVPEEMKEIATIVTVQHDTRTAVTGIIRNLFSDLPYTVSKYHTGKMESALRHLCEEKLFDVVHVDHAHLAPYGLIAKKEFRIPFCLREHNYETKIYKRYGEAQGFSLLKSYMRMQTRRLQRYEHQQLVAVDLCIAITDEDAQSIREAVNIPIHVVPAGVDLDSHPMLSRANEKANSILIIGSLTWQPNVDALQWFLTDVFPLVQKKIPSAVVTIAGISPPKKILALQSDYIRVLGFVDDIQSLIASAQVLAIPLRVGGGMRIKMLESFAYGKAVVATKVGAEGNNAINGEHFLQTDFPEDFASSIVALFQSSDLRSRIGDAARKFVEMHYAWTAIAKQFEQAYYFAIESSRSK